MRRYGHVHAGSSPLAPRSWRFVGRGFHTDGVVALALVQRPRAGAERAGRVADRRPRRGADRERRPGTDEQAAAERADAHVDLRAPVALRGDHARLLLRRAELAGRHPAQPVEAREVLDLPVARRPRLDAQHLAAGARPVQRAVVVVPRELQAAVGGQRVGQRLRVEQGPADVEPRRHDDGGEAGDHDDRQRRDRAVALDALEAQERAQQDREHDPLQPGVPTLDLHGGDGEQDAERDRGGQRARAGRPSGAARTRATRRGPRAARR